MQFQPPRAALSRMEKELQQVRKKWRKLWRQQHSEECAQVEEVFDTWPHLQREATGKMVGAHWLRLNHWADGPELKVEWFKLLENAEESCFLVFSSHALKIA